MTNTLRLFEFYSTAIFLYLRSLAFICVVRVFFCSYLFDYKEYFVGISQGLYSFFRLFPVTTINHIATNFANKRQAQHAT
jgi:hypothetical protein